MQVNHDYDLSKAVASAVRATAPFVGIPLPGHAPLTLQRKRLAAALKGVRPVSIEVLTAEEYETVSVNDGRNWRYGSEEIKSNVRYLVIEGYANEGRVRTRMAMRAIPAAYWKTWQGKEALGKWRDQERRQQGKAIGMPADRKQAASFKRATKTLQKLQRELDKLGCPYSLRNPAVPYLTSTPNEGVRDLCITPRFTRRTRRIIGGIAAEARRERWTSRQVYGHLESRGYEFEKMTDMTGKERERYGATTFGDYLRNLHRFVKDAGLYHRTHILGRGYHGDGQTWGSERYMGKLADLQTRRSLQAQIDSIKAIVAEQGTGGHESQRIAA